GHVPGYLADRKAANDPVITFVRHGLAGGNLADRWEGHTCSGLSEVGREQAARLGALMGPVERLVSSDTPRAAETASYLGKPGLDPGLREMWFGSWEGLEHSAVTQHHGDLLGRIYRDRQDLPRGGDGE